MPDFNRELDETYSKLEFGHADDPLLELVNSLLIKYESDPKFTVRDFTDRLRKREAQLLLDAAVGLQELYAGERTTAVNYLKERAQNV